MAAYRYDPFGNLLAQRGTFTQPFRFMTKRTDTGAGLVSFGYRFYAPELGRWLTRDPLGEAGGLNLYAFVGNNPVNWVDPWGLKTIVIITTDIFNVLGVKIEIGSHAAVYIDNNGDPGLYDPAGSYGNRLIIGYGDFIGSDYQHVGIQGANLTDYIAILNHM